MWDILSFLYVLSLLGVAGTFSRAPAFITRSTICDEMEGLHVLDRALRLD